MSIFNTNLVFLEQQSKTKRVLVLQGGARS